MAIDGYVDIACFDDDGEVIEESDECLRIGFSSFSDQPGIVTLQKVTKRETPEEKSCFVARFSVEEMEKAAHIARIAEGR